MSSKCAVIEVAPPARSRSIDFRSAAAASSRDVGSIENPEISAGPNRTVPMIRPSFLTEKWDRCSSGGSARYRSRWTLRSLVGRSVRPETKVCQYAWASVVCKGSRLNGTAPARGSRNIKLRPRRFYAEGGPSTRCMDFGLTEIQEITRKTVRDFAEQQVIPQSRAFDESQEFPHAWAKKMGELGLFGVFVPEKYGGAGLDTVCYAITIEELSRGDASAGVIAAVCNGLVCEPLLHYGTEEQKRRFLEPVARGEWMGAYALTEPGSGSDAAAMRTTATLERDEWVLRGTKTFATNGSVAKIIVVYARTGAKEHEISAFVVPTDAKGFSVLNKEDKMGIRASDTVTLGFDGCRIPKENLLGDLHKGFTIAMETLDGGRIGIAAQALGIGQRPIEPSTPRFRFTAATDSSRITWWRSCTGTNASRKSTKGPPRSSGSSSRVRFSAAENTQVPSVPEPILRRAFMPPWLLRHDGHARSLHGGAPGTGSGPELRAEVRLADRRT